MSSSKVIGLTVVTLLGAAAWWLLSDSESQRSRLDQSAPSQSESFVREAAAGSVPPALAPADDGAVSGDVTAREDASDEDVAPGSARWSAEVTKFFAQADPDPALSREIEYTIARSLDASLDRGRFDVESVACRGYQCQILSVERTPTPTESGLQAMQQGWGPNVARLMLQLKETGIQHPGTGARIDDPQLNRLIMGDGIVTLIGFKEP